MVKWCGWSQYQGGWTRHTCHATRGGAALPTRYLAYFLFWQHKFRGVHHGLEKYVNLI